MRHIELGIGPPDQDPGIQKLLVGIVIGAVTARPLRVELHPYVDAGFLPVDDGRDETRFGKRELFYKKRSLRSIDEFADWFQAVIGLDNQTRRERKHNFGMASTGGIASLCYRSIVQLPLTRW